MEGDLPYARSAIRHFAADLPYFEERDRGQNWALIYLIAEEAPRECLRASARMWSRGSRIPEVVTAEMITLGLMSKGSADQMLLKAVLTKRLKYIELDDGLCGYLDFDDSNEVK
ncbi:hypothetical protein B0H14DRAFT_3150385 [Mycena olivaceomarginata]|nr:hypothetical protein B0H14DRAFT_3150385 [Mycena olivaceomarginata]